MSKECTMILLIGQKDFKMVDYNIPVFEKTPLDNTKVLCEYWALKNAPDVKVIGTELQCYNLFTEKLKGKDSWQINLDYQDELLPEYAEAYEDNNKKPLIINLK